MTKKLQLKIITPQEILIDEPVDEVYSKSTTGGFGILPGHAPYMTDLDIGVTEYRKEGQKNFISTIGGIIQVKDDIITVLSDTAEPGDRIDVARARAARERAEARLKAGTSDINIDRAQMALARALARIQAASGKK